MLYLQQPGKVVVVLIYWLKELGLESRKPFSDCPWHPR